MHPPSVRTHDGLGRPERWLADWFSCQADGS